MLGYEAGYTAKGARYNAFNFEKRAGTGTMVFLNNFGCIGNETNLLDCSYVNILDGSSTCSHANDASVMCLQNGKACIFDINVSTWFVLTRNLGQLYLQVGSSP